MVTDVVLPIVLLAAQAASPPPIQKQTCVVPAQSVRPALTADVRWITSLDAALLAQPRELRDRRIALRDAHVEQLDAKGFWIGAANGCRLFVVPAEGPLVPVETGDVIDLQGEFRVRSVPVGTHEAADTMYVYAYIVRKVPVEQP